MSYQALEPHVTAQCLREFFSIDIFLLAFPPGTHPFKCVTTLLRWKTSYSNWKTLNLRIALLQHCYHVPRCTVIITTYIKTHN